MRTNVSLTFAYPLVERRTNISDRDKGDTARINSRTKFFSAINSYYIVFVILFMLSLLFPPRNLNLLIKFF